MGGAVMGWVLWFGVCVALAVSFAVYGPAWIAACWGFNAGIAVAIIEESRR
jgi:hypothetical protein